MTLERWEHRDERVVADLSIFQVRSVRARSPRTGQDRALSLLTTGDWVNVVALTPDRQVVLVRQFRHGVREFTVEIPGGLVDPGETPTAAGVRELLEETGYAGSAPRVLGVVEPNPAFLNNRCTTILIQQCAPAAPPTPDEGEDIEVELRPLDEVLGLIGRGEITHALVICAFWWLTHAAG